MGEVESRDLSPDSVSAEHEVNGEGPVSVSVSSAAAGETTAQQRINIH